MNKWNTHIAHTIAQLKSGGHKIIPLVLTARGREHQTAVAAVTTTITKTENHISSSKSLYCLYYFIFMPFIWWLQYIFSAAHLLRLKRQWLKNGYGINKKKPTSQTLSFWCVLLANADNCHSNDEHIVCIRTEQPWLNSFESLRPSQSHWYMESKIWNSRQKNHHRAHRYNRSTEQYKSKLHSL